VSRPTLTADHITPTGLSPATAQLSNWFGFFSQHGLVRVRSPLLTESQLMSFPPGTEMFQFPGFALKTLCIQELSTWFCFLMNDPKV
jgi:hypothetical protein